MDGKMTKNLISTLCVSFFCVILAKNPQQNEITPKLLTGNAPHDEINILQLMNISANDHGASMVKGPIATLPAYKFRSQYGNMPLIHSAEVVQALNNRNLEGFTVLFIYRQEKNNSGTLISINSPGRLTPWFELTSNSRKNLLTLKFRLDLAKKLRQIQWSLPEHRGRFSHGAWTWLSLTVDFSTGLVRLDLNCQLSRYESLTSDGKNKKRIIIPQDSLVYFIQETGRKQKFVGLMQVAKVLLHVPQKRLWECAEIGLKSKSRPSRLEKTIF